MGIDGYIEIKSDATFRINGKEYDPTRDGYKSKKNTVNHTINVLKKILQNGGIVENNQLSKEDNKRFSPNVFNLMMQNYNIPITISGDRNGYKRIQNNEHEGTRGQYIFIMGEEQYLFDASRESEGAIRKLSKEEWDNYRPFEIQTDYRRVPGYSNFKELFTDNALPHYSVLYMSDDVSSDLRNTYSHIPQLCCAFSIDNNSKLLIVEGSFGRGKTYSLIAAAQLLNSKNVPSVFLNAKELEQNATKTNYEHPIYSYVHSKYGIPATVIKDNKGVVFIVDGIEELSYTNKVEDCQRGIRNNIIDLCNNGHKVIISVRNREAFMGDDEGLKSSLSMIVKLKKLERKQIEKISSELIEIVTRYPELRTPLFVCNFKKISEFEIELIEEKGVRLSDVYGKIENKKRIRNYYDLFSVVTNMNIYRFHNVGTQSELYSKLLPLIAYSSINRDDVTIETIIKKIHENRCVFNYRTNLGKLKDEWSSRNKLASMLEGTGAAIIINNDLIQINHQEYRNYLAARFLIMKMETNSVRLDEAIDEVINQTRYYRDEKGEYNLEGIRLQIFSYGEYTFRMLIDENYIDNERINISDIKRKILLLGLHVGYELEYRIWDDIKGLIEWGLDYLEEKESTYDDIDIRILLGMSGYLYSLNKIRPEYFGYYKKGNRYKDEEYIDYLFRKREIIETITLPNLERIRGILESNDDGEMIKAISIFQEDFFGSLLGNIGAANLALAILDDEVGDGIARGGHLESAIKYHEEGNTNKNGKYARARGYISLATDYFYAGKYETAPEKRKVFYENSISYHRKALELYGIRWDENSRDYTSNGELKEDRDVTDADPIVTLRRIAGCQCRLWEVNMDRESALLYYASWSYFIGLLKEMCTDNQGEYNKYRIQSGTIADEIRGAVIDYKENKQGKCIQQSFFADDSTRKNIRKCLQTLQELYSILENIDEDLLGYWGLK